MEKVTLCTPTLRLHQWTNLDTEMYDILSNPTTRVVKLGRKVIGQVVQQVKWIAFTPSGIKGKFTTRKEAVAWLTLLEEHPKAAAHLERIKGVITTKAPRVIRAEHDTDDNGLFDVLKSFAISLGYQVLDHHRRSRAEWGSIVINQWIVVKPNSSNLMRAGTMAHEIGHHYEWKLGFRGRLKARREPLVEAIAYAVLYDYGLDISEFSRSYMDNWSGRRSYFVDGQLDKAFTLCYTAFSEELEKFLSTR